MCLQPTETKCELAFVRTFWAGSPEFQIMDAEMVVVVMMMAMMMMMMMRVMWCCAVGRVVLVVVMATFRRLC